METASSYFYNYNSTSSDYYITNIDSDNLSISIQSLSNSTKPQAGQIISSSFCSFYLTSPTTASFISGDFSSVDSSTTLIISDRFSLPKIYHKIIDDSVPLGTLLVKLSLPLTHTAGYLGWSLIKDNTLILVGNDLLYKSFISFYDYNNWDTGNYRLVLGLYEPSTKGLLSVSDKEWSIDTPTSTFKFGFEDDFSNPIKL